ncbi:MAG: hypothetical protein PF570_09330 [Candidatus Cloacimonetes bacterium]|nr:hypothetical protein [Candidatus Cloacimonadota bacterium]
MRKSTIMIISILAMLLLAGSLMGFCANISVDTNYDGFAYIEIVIAGTNPPIVADRIPSTGTFAIDSNSNNTQTSGYLNPDHLGYIATIYAHKVVNGVTITDTDSHNFHYGIATFTLTVDLSGNGAVPNNPQMQD